MKARDIVIMGLAIALTVVISCLSFKVVIPGFFPVKITFSLIIIFFVSVRISPQKGAVVAALAYILQSFVFAKNMFFPGFALTEFLSGIMLGYLFKLFNKKLFNKKLMNNFAVPSLEKKIYFCSCLLSVTFTKLTTCLINTLWLCILLHAPFGFLLVPRLIVAVVVIFIITPVIYGLSGFVEHII